MRRGWLQFVCPLAYLKNHSSKFHQIFCTSHVTYGRLLMTAVQYMYVLDIYSRCLISRFLFRLRNSRNKGHANIEGFTGNIQYHQIPYSTSRPPNHPYLHNLITSGRSKKKVVGDNTESVETLTPCITLWVHNRSGGSPPSPRRGIMHF